MTITYSRTWRRINNQLACAIVYLVDALYRKQDISPIEDLLDYKQIGKVFLVSWTDGGRHDQRYFEQIAEQHLIYDAEEEDPLYLQRMLDRKPS